MPEQRLRLLVLGAHPDDADFSAGGLVSCYCELGHTVKMISVTDGGAGHQSRPSEELRLMRRGEAAASGRLVGAQYEVWDYRDGELEPSLNLRHRIIAEVRRFAPDLLLTHRPYDYHPDHRAVGQAVQDASYLVRVPKVVPGQPAIARDPVVGYMPDLFTRPCPLSADVIIDITDRIETVVAMLDCHRSQVYEWLPYIDGILDQVPVDDAQRRQWLRGWFGQMLERRTNHFRPQIEAAFGAARAQGIRFVEVFEISQYATPLDAAARARLFPMAPREASGR